MKERSVQFFKGQQRHRIAGIQAQPRGAPAFPAVVMIVAACGADGPYHQTPRNRVIRFVSRAPVTCKECQE